jgi:hypothetical protein
MKCECGHEECLGFICPECKNHIDPDCCWCGCGPNPSWHDGHSFIAAGCTCGYHKEASE